MTRQRTYAIRLGINPQADLSEALVSKWEWSKNAKPPNRVSTHNSSLRTAIRLLLLMYLRYLPQQKYH